MYAQAKQIPASLGVYAWLYPTGLESFPMDWPDANLTENDNFLSFVDCAVKQSLEPYRNGQGRNGLLVCTLTLCCSMLQLRLRLAEVNGV